MRPPAPLAPGLLQADTIYIIAIFSSIFAEMYLNNGFVHHLVRDRGASEGMKPLLPTLKERQRYVLYETITVHPLGLDISDILLQRLAEILGVFGSGRCGVLSISYDQSTQSGILRCNHDAVLELKAALLMVTHVGKTPCIIRIRGVSGTLEGSKRFLPNVASAQKTTKETTKGLRVQRLKV